MIIKLNIIQNNSSDGGFLQSAEWRKFQETAGRRTFLISKDSYSASIIEHELPIVGKYFYIPRGPATQNLEPGAQNLFKSLINLAKENNAGWIRFDAANNEILELIKDYSVKKAPHDMQPRELFIIEIAKPEEQLLAEMKSKTRYNIKVAQKHGIIIRVTNNQQLKTNNYFEEFLRLTKLTARRDNITPHPDAYYRKMLETIPAENLKLYLAEYENKIIAANVVVFYGKIATYLHGASDNQYRNVMAPYLLQWRQILDAKKAGCEKYDFGGINTNNQQPATNNWTGITRFKTGFSTTTRSTEFLGSHDIVINPFRYNLYIILQSVKTSFLKLFGL